MQMENLFASLLGSRTMESLLGDEEAQSSRWNTCIMLRYVQLYPVPLPTYFADQAILAIPPLPC